MEQTPSWRINNHSVKKVLAFFGSQRFISFFTTDHNLSLPWGRCIQSTPTHPISLRFILILSSHLHLGFLSGPFLQVLEPNVWKHFHLFICATCPKHFILVYLITPTIFDEAHKLWSSHHFLPLRSKYFPLHTLLTHPQSIFFLSVRDQISHPYKTTGRIIVLYILILKFLDRRWEDKRFWTE